MLQPAGALHRSNTSASSGGLAGRRLSAATTNGTGATAEAAADEPICVGAYQVRAVGVFRQICTAAGQSGSGPIQAN